MLGTIRSRRGTPRALLLAIIACAMFARLLVPQGWMPVAGNGGWRITICTGSGPMEMAMPSVMAATMKGMHHGSDSQDHGSSDHPCAFSSLALALNAPPQLAIDLPAVAIGRWLSFARGAVSVGRGLAAPPPPSTGPPLTL